MRKFIILALLFLCVCSTVNAQNEKPEIVLQKGHSSPITSLAFGSNGRALISGERNGIVKFWDLQTGLNLRDIYLNSELKKGFSANASGRIIFTPAKDECAFWDLQTGKKLKSFECGDGNNYFSNRAFSFSNQILAVGEQGSFSVSNQAKKTYVSLEGEIVQVEGLAFSPDGKILAVSSGWIKLYEAESGKFLREMISGNFTGDVRNLVFSADGKTLAGKTENASEFNAKSNIIVWDAASGVQKAIYNAGLVPMNIALSNDGATVAAGTETGKIALYENNSPTPRFLDNRTAVATAFAFSPDGRLLASGDMNGGLKIWDWRGERELASLGTKILPVSNVAIDGDNRRLFVAQKNYNFTLDGGVEFDSSTKIFETEGSLKNGFLPKSANGVQISDFIFAPDGKTFLMSWITLGKPGVDAIPGGFVQAKTDTAQPVVLGTGKEPTFQNYAYSPDGKLLATGGKLNAVNVWNLTQNKLIYKILDKWDGAVGLTKTVLSFTPDGKTLLRAGDDSKIRFFDAATGQPQKVLDFTRQNQRFYNFSPDAQFIAFSGINNDDDRRKLYLWNVAESKVTHTFSGHAGEVNSAAFTADGKILISADESGTIKFWNIAGQKEVANLVITGDNDWVVTTPEGLFDGTPTAWRKLFWRFDNDVSKLAPLEAFFNEFYYPNLLKEILAGNTLPPPKRNLSEIDTRQPKVRIKQIGTQTIADKSPARNGKTPIDVADRNVEVTVEITENNQKTARPLQPALSGASDARLFRNGSLVRHWKGDIFDRASGCEILATQPNEPRRAVCKTSLTVLAGANDLSAYAFNRENVKSGNESVSLKGATELERKGTLYILAIGVNKYQNASHNLKYAVADADSISGELTAQQTKSLGKNYADVKVVKLTDEHATRENILSALQRFSSNAKIGNSSAEVASELEKIKPAQPEDALVVYYAGHGTASKDRFYLIPHDGFPADGLVSENYLQSLYAQSVSDEELEKSLETVDAGKILMIIDACNSGQALNAEEQRRGPMNSRGLAQLAYEKGIYILTAAQSEQAALEVSKFGHGLLTYSLLEGLRKAEKSGDGTITERNWFDYAVRQVPQMQIDEMKKRDVEIKSGKSDSRSGVVFIKGANKNLPPEKRGLQSPRIFYRREAEENPFVVAKP